MLGSALPGLQTQALGVVSQQKRSSLAVSGFGPLYLVLRLCLIPECEGLCIEGAKQRAYPYISLIFHERVVEIQMP